MMNDLYKIHSFYKFSLDSFVIVVKRAIDIVAAADKAKAKAAAGGDAGGEGGEGAAEGEEGAAEGEEAAAEEPKADDAAEGEETGEIVEMTPKTLAKRVEDLTESITYQAFNYTRRGTFEQHKLTLSTMLTFKILARNGRLNQAEIDHLVKKEIALEPPHQQESLKFIPEAFWGAVKGLESIKVFEHLINNMESEPHLFKKWYGDEKPEQCDLPKTIKDISLFHRILLLRAVRPDRLSNALTDYVAEEMGTKYVEQSPFDIVATAEEMNPQTPTFFVLFPGVDPTPEVELIGKMVGKTLVNEKFINISMGQGQEQNAIKALK
jgi:dynein heavy chain